MLLRSSKTRDVEGRSMYSSLVLEVVLLAM